VALQQASLAVRPLISSLFGRKRENADAALMSVLQPQDVAQGTAGLKRAHLTQNRPQCQCTAHSAPLPCTKQM
jgi:hypothetical protein